MDNLLLLKQILQIQDSTQDILLQHYLDKARLAIRTYLNYDEIGSEYDPVIMEYAQFNYENRHSIGRKQESQGSRSQSIVDGIPQFIKDQLPPPRIKVL